MEYARGVGGAKNYRILEHPPKTMEYGGATLLESLETWNSGTLKP